MHLLLNMPDGPVMFGAADPQVTLPFLSAGNQQVFAIKPSEECGLAPSQLISTNGLLLDVKPVGQVVEAEDLVVVSTQPHQDLVVCGQLYARANSSIAFCLIGALPGSEQELEHYSAAEQPSMGAGTELYVFLGADDLSIGLITLESAETTFAELRQRILDELDDLPPQFCFLFNGAKMGLKQESKRLVSELPDNRVAIKSVKRKRPAPAVPEKPADLSAAVASSPTAAAPAAAAPAPAATAFGAPPPCPFIDFDAPDTPAPAVVVRPLVISKPKLRPTPAPASPAGDDLLNAIRGFQGRNGLRKVDEDEVLRSRQEASERMQTQGLGGMFVSLKHTLASRRVAMEEEEGDSDDEWSD
jgi:hypothetical protein